MSISIPIYWLNLDRRKDKREWFEKTNGFPSLNMQRIRAIDPELFKLSSTGCAETNGHMACWLSHYMILNMVVNSGHRGAIVLEDDAKLVDDFPNHLSFLSLIDGFVHLGGMQSKNWGTWAYYVSRSQAKRMVDDLRERTEHIDWQIFKKREEWNLLRYPIALATHEDIGISDTTGDENPRLLTIYPKEVAV